MTMNKLKCQVNTCRYNKDNLCSLNKIQVDGPAAMESRETCCASYAERTRSARNESSCGCASPKESTDIHCSAEHCTYNENKKCHADCVCVGCCCSDPSVVSETECSTFEPRA